MSAVEQVVDALSHVDDPASPAIQRLADELRVGTVLRDGDGRIIWSDTTYRLHGRPRWRRVRTLSDALEAVVSGQEELATAHLALAQGYAVTATYVVQGEYDMEHTVVMTVVGQGLALVSQFDHDASIKEPVTHELTIDLTDSQLPQELPIPQGDLPPEESPPEANDSEPRREDDGWANAVLSATPDVLVVYDLDTDVVVTVTGDSDHTSALTERLNSGAKLLALLNESDAVELFRDFRRRVRSMGPGDVERITLPLKIDGVDRWHEIRCVPLAHHDTGRVSRCLAIARDVQDQRNATRATAESEHRWRDLFAISPVGLAVIDDHGRFDQINDAFCTLVGRTREDVTSTVYDALLHPEDRAAAVTTRARWLSEGRASTVRERRLLRADGRVVWAKVRSSPFDFDGQSHTLISAEDVTAAKEIENQLRLEAMHDVLTGLPNRRLLVDRLERALTRARRTNSRLAAFFIDVDDLKRVNDIHGHGAGDKLIVAVANGLRETLRDADTLARIGGDEFVVICEDIGDDESITEVGQRLSRAVRQPMTFDGEVVPVSLSVGVAVPASDDEDAESLLQRADAAMYRAKRAGGSQLSRDAHVTTMSGRASTPTLDAWTAALRDGSLQLHYQPAVSCKTGTLLGVEASLRWVHPEFGVLTDIEFLETPGVGAVSGELVRWSVKRALSDLRTVAPNRARPLTLWLNVPSRSLLHTQTVPELAAAFAVDAVSGGHAPTLILEVHEQEVAALLRRGHPPKALDRLVHAGPVALGIDRYRADSVALGMLRRLPLASLKLDGDVLTQAAQGRDGMELLVGLVATSRAIGLTTIATEVERLEQWEIALSTGVDAIQGDLIGPIAPLEVYGDLLQRGFLDLPTPLLNATNAVPDQGTVQSATPSAIQASATPPPPAAPRPTPTPAPTPAPAYAPITDIGAALAAEIGISLPGEQDLPWEDSPAEDLPKAPTATAAPQVPDARMAPTSFAGFTLPPSPYLFRKGRENGGAS